MNDTYSEHPAQEEVEEGSTPLYDQTAEEQVTGPNVVAVDGDNPESVEEAARTHHESHGA